MSVKQRALFETAVVERLKQSGFLEVEIRVEALVRTDDGYQDEVINAGWHYWNAALEANDIGTCPVCDEILVPNDVCSTDIEMGICHAECLEGAAVVDLDTGEPSEGPVDTYLYGKFNSTYQGLSVTEPLKTTQLSFGEGAGRLIFEDGIIRFEGNADQSAKVFFEYLSSLYCAEFANRPQCQEVQQ